MQIKHPAYEEDNTDREINPCPSDFHTEIGALVAGLFQSELFKIIEVMRVLGVWVGYSDY